MLPLPSPVVRRKYNNCSVPTCEKHYPPLQDKRFYRLPKDPKRRQQWVEILGISSELSKSRLGLSVCGDHFGDEAFTDTLRLRLNRYAKPLVPHSLVSNIVEVATSEQSVPNELSKTRVEESVHTGPTSEKIHYTIDVNGTAISLSQNKSDAEVQKKTREDKNKKVSQKNDVSVYKLPSGRKVMFYHLPILKNLK
ncbi:unnamed protein product [Psylliodes chrysocephalus]|uniref:THAP-type domain-containing protein n=1 Tax=Psylliodes chrysocephalus TaxID=3402493 RepID=A0A9P0CPA0_9CUCU|nr:unnamed protein product [Psylliodes chrysocephala]